MRHYHAVAQARDDVSLGVAIAEAIAHYESEYQDALSDLAPVGRIWDVSKKLPGLMTYRYGQSEELAAMLDHINSRVEKRTRDKARHILETMARAMNEREAMKWAEIDEEVLFLRELKNEVSMMHGKFLGITKGIEGLHYQISNLVKLRGAGIEDATF